MRWILIGTVVAGVAIGLVVPLDFITVTPPQPDAELPTFAETREKVGEHGSEPPPPAYGENPERRKLRKAVLHAASQLEFNPCSKDLRKKFAVAARRLVESIEDGPRELAVINGKEKNVSKRYDKPATDAIFKALMKGQIAPADLTDRWRRMFARAQSTAFPAARAACSG